MARFFNTAGPCRSDRHYMLPAERRVAGLRRLIDQQLYFVVHAPRQVGKTTSLRVLAENLTAEGRYTALLTSCEVGQKLTADLEGSIAGILAHLHLQAEASLPEELRPPPTDTGQPPESRLRHLLQRWAQASPRPVVLFLDEIDALFDDALISVLRQLRAGYDARPRSFPQSVALIGLRDVRDYKIRAQGPAGTMGTASPFNIKSDSLRLRNFTAGEVAELYRQHTDDSGQPFAPETAARAFDLTGGHPWLVNALARHLVEELVPDRRTAIDAAHLEAAKEMLIARRATHVDSLIDRLREDRVRKVLEPILAGGFPADDVLDDDIQFVKDLGLVASGSRGLRIANPIYQEIIPRALTSVTEEYLAVARTAFIADDGRLLWDQLLDGFLAFWRQNAEWMLKRQPYSEAAAQLVFMAFLHRVVNGGGELVAGSPYAGAGAAIDREFAVGSGRVDLLVRWPLPSGEVERFAVELKVRREGDGDLLEPGLAQLGEYLDRLGLERGTLVLFDQREKAPPLPERCSRSEVDRGGRRVTVLEL